ncbi:M23 family metallopeptidase, partial [Capnocytophaga cynodegmi]|uniref:M23 family metallopeptidase n=1 Tax=Capnocytophaga cynodegmi TaxID=28189 RepID=UPI00385B4987
KDILKTDTFWYFEPFAWVEQMKRVFSVCPDDCSQCVDYQDVVTTPRLNNQSNNVNKNRFRRVKRYNATYPYPKGYYHTGTDILAPSGEEVYAMLCGEVYSVVNVFKPNEYKANSLGNYLVIKSKDREGRVVYLQYSHLDEVLVKKGQKIKHGEIIGKAGSTGNAASVYNEKGVLIHGIYPEYRHIHIEAFLESFSKKNRIDPEQFMKTKFDETTKGNVIK